MQELKENCILLENVRICYSPFSRTIHTAKVAASALNLPFESPLCKVKELFSFHLCLCEESGRPLLWIQYVLHLPPADHYINFDMQMMEDLRERYFGPSFELLSHDKVR